MVLQIFQWLLLINNSKCVEDAVNLWNNGDFYYFL
jgi:hypothetical protein